MTPLTREDRAVFRTIPYLDDLEMLDARYFSHTFGVHIHDRYALSIIHKGAGCFTYHGRECVAVQGNLTILNPNEPHDGCVLDKNGWFYSIIYIKPDYFTDIASDFGIAGQDRLTFVDEPVFSSPWIYQQLAAFHSALITPQHDMLALESRLQKILAFLIREHASPGANLKPLRWEIKPLKRVSDYINDNYMDKITLARLGRIAGMSKFHLLRAFKKHYGMSPHLYLNQVRIDRAKIMLAKGRSIVEAAHLSGFFDQSHLTRNFKRSIGVTPGMFLKNSNIFQDGFSG